MQTDITTIEDTLKHYFGDTWDLITTTCKDLIYEGLDAHNINPSDIKSVECDDKIMVITTKGFLIFPTVFYG